MKKIIFLRTAPYLYQIPGKSLYQSLDDIGLQKAQPHILEPNAETKNKIDLILEKYQPDKILCSRLIRSQETARLFSKDIRIVTELDEIQFSMNDFSKSDELSDNKFDSKLINKIRYNFSQALIRDQLYERKEHVIERIFHFKNLINGIAVSETIICCSHGFIMKLYENSFRLNYQANDFETVVSLHDWKKPPFKFLDGFVIVQQDGMFNVTRKGII